MMLIFLVFIIALVYFLQAIRTRRTRGMMLKFPQAKEVPIFGSSFKLFGRSEDTMKRVINISKEITEGGGAVGFSIINYLFVVGLTDADDIAEVLKSSLDKGYLYSFIKPLAGNGSAFASAALAKTRRKMLLPSFTTRVLNCFFDTIFHEASIRLAKELAPMAGTEPFSADQILGEWSFNTFIRTMGVFDTESTFSSEEFYNSLKRSDEIIYNRIYSIWKHPDVLYKLTYNFQEHNRLINIIYDNAHKVLKYLKSAREINVELKKEVDENHADIKKPVLEELLKSNLSDREICEELVVLIGASQLTSYSMGYVLMLLGQYPLVQDKVVKEIEVLLGDRDRVTKEDLSKLEYLDMVIKESLRLFPPAPAIVRKVLKDVPLPSGRVIPAGVEVAVLIYGLHRNIKYWGPHADHFDPDRFNPKRFANVPPNAYIPFSSGPRNCIGYRYGIMAIKVALCTILRKYKIVGKPAEGPLPDIPTKYELFMKSLDDFTIQIILRYYSVSFLFLLKYNIGLNLPNSLQNHQPN